MISETFVYTIYISTTPEKLWEALTNGAFTEKYFFGRKVQSDWQEGSKVTYLRENDELDVEGEVLKAKPYRLLTFTWNHADDTTERIKPSRVTFELYPMKDTVKLMLVHDDLSIEDLSNDKYTFQGANNGSASH